MEFTPLRDACEIMIAVVTTLDPRKDRFGLTPVEELDTTRVASQAKKHILRRRKNVGFREVQICVRKLAVNSGVCAILDCSALPL